MLLSKSCVYAIRAALLVAVKLREADRRYVPVKELARELGLSFHFLAKIVQVLTQARILESFRGPNGGIGLGREAGSITLIDIVEAMDGLGMFENCVLGLPGCGKETPCPLHDDWANRRDNLKSFFTLTSLATLAQRMTEQDLRG